MKMGRLKRKELIGLAVTVVDASNQLLIGIKGKVVDETMNMLVLDNGKKIIKSQAVIKVNDSIIKGENINKRLKERLKK